MDSKSYNRFFKLTMRKMGFFWIVIPFMDMKSHTHTRQIFLAYYISYLKCCGKRGDPVAYKW